MILKISPIVPNRYYFATMSGSKEPPNRQNFLYFCIDECIPYPNIQSYFGPPSLGKWTSISTLHVYIYTFFKCIGDVYRYAVMMNSLMSATSPNVRIIHCTSQTDEAKRANAAFLVGAYAMLYLYIPPRLVYRSLKSGGQSDFKYGTTNTKTGLIFLYRFHL